MSTTRIATTQWKGSFSKGAGQVVFDSSELGPFHVMAAVGPVEIPGRTSPMELLAAAHSACVGITLAYMLTKCGHPAEWLDTSAEVDLDHVEGITGIRLTVRGLVPGISDEEFVSMAALVADSCPVGRALSGIDVTLDAATS